MKSIRNVFMLALLAALPVLSFAANKKTITLSDPVAVGTTVLKPGQYVVEWSGDGAQVPVKFEQNNKTLATAQATLKKQSSPYDSVQLNSKAGSKEKVLNQINFTKETLVFQNGAGSSGE